MKLKKALCQPHLKKPDKALQHHARPSEAPTCVSHLKETPWLFILWSLGSGASCNFDQLAHGTTGKWISSINQRTLFRMEIKDSCPRLLKRQVWHHQSALYELALVHPQTFGEMSLSIFTQWPSCVRPALLTADASGVLSSREGHLCLFSIRSASLSSLSSLRTHFTLYVSIHYSYVEMGWSRWWTTRDLTVLTDAVSAFPYTHLPQQRQSRCVWFITAHII